MMFGFVRALFATFYWPVLDRVRAGLVILRSLNFCFFFPLVFFYIFPVAVRDRNPMAGPIKHVEKSGKSR